MDIEEQVVLKVGDRYQLRNGLTTSPLRFDKNCPTNYKWEAEVDEFPGRPLSVMCWLEEGSFLLRDLEHRHDIIKRV